VRVTFTASWAANVTFAAGVGSLFPWVRRPRARRAGAGVRAARPAVRDAREELSCARHPPLAASARDLHERAAKQCVKPGDPASPSHIIQCMSAAAQLTAPAGAPAGRILVVDDEPNVAGFVGRALRAKGFAVDVALGGERGLEAAHEDRYALIVLDLRMRDVNGLVILRQVMKARPDQRVLVLSAASDVEVKVRCLELGAADFVPKPFELAELIARVGAHLRRHTEAPPAPERYLRAGRVTLDLLRRAADVGGRPVSLSEREFGVLRHLMARAGRPCKREELLADVWEMDFDPQTNVVDAYVHRLREKLGPGLIETVRNLGYVLDA
jgi:two-component system, OmpR family, response regulator